MAVVARGHRPARPSLRDRGRGRLDPHRRGADAADHLGRARDRRARPTTTSRASPSTLEGVPRRSAPEDEAPRGARRRLPLRREVQDRLADRAGRSRRSSARSGSRTSTTPRNVQLVNHLDPGAEGRVALPARRRLRRPGRRGEDRRRVHRPDHGRAPLVGGPAPGGRGEGGRADPGGARHPRHDHAPELLPPLREARRHDRHREDRGEGVRRDLRPRRRRDPDERRRSRATTRTT